MYIFLMIVAAILVIILLLIVIAPTKYNVSRSITINKPVEEVYGYLRLMKNQQVWSPWQKRDPDMKQVYTGTDGTIGFFAHWESDHKQVGWGEQEITGLIPNKKIETELRFLKPWESTSNGYFDLESNTNGGTNLVWGFHGTHKVPVNVMMMLMFNMDKAVGKDFEEGLAKLKKVLEA